MINRIYGLLGICAKAGDVVSGTDVTIETVEKGKAKIVIVAQDCSDKTIKNMKYICDKNNVPIYVFGNIEDISKAIGKNNRGIVGIKNENLAKEIIKLICGGDTIGQN